MSHFYCVNDVVAFLYEGHIVTGIIVQIQPQIISWPIALRNKIKLMIRIKFKNPKYQERIDWCILNEERILYILRNDRRLSPPHMNKASTSIQKFLRKENV